ncbi:MAG TPA: hypothetical protein VNO81_07895 [Candidatus Nitrosotenuis sp.]|nr:hypothetical protein [Candidatus Nitrosotenuis sp.]
MEIVRVYVFPAFLLLGALALALVEVRALRTEGRAGRPNWVRFWRRLAGSVLMVAVGAMVALGDSSPGGEMRAAVARLQYWMYVLVLVGVAMALAFWDVLDGLRSLRRYVEDVERDEMRRLKDHLQQLRQEPGRKSP